MKDPTEIWNKYMYEEYHQDEVDKLSDANYYRMVLMIEEYDNIFYIISNKYCLCKPSPSDDDMCRFIERVYHKFNEKVFHNCLNLQNFEIIKNYNVGKNISCFSYHIVLDGGIVEDKEFRLYLIHKFEYICFLHKLDRILNYDNL